MKYKLVIADVDGTLINDKHEITPITRDAINRFRNLGGIFTIATGRGIRSAHPFIENMHIDVPVILFNGSMIYHPVKNKILYNRFLPDSLYKKIVKLWDTGKYNVDMLVFTGKGVYVKKVTELVRRFMDIDHVYCKETENLLDVDNVIKILFLGDADISRRLVNELRKSEMYFSCVQSDEIFIEILPHGVTKGSTLSRLCEILNININDVIAFGDQDNDREMICKAGCGIAMGNADDEIKRCANYVTKTNLEDGIGYFLNNLIENEVN